MTVVLWGIVAVLMVVGIAGTVLPALPGATFVFACGLAPLFVALGARGGRRVLLAVLGVCVWWNVSLMVQFGLRLMDRQRLVWPDVARNQVTEVPRRLGRTAWLYLTDRERLVRETR